MYTHRHIQAHVHDTYTRRADMDAQTQTHTNTSTNTCIHTCPHTCTHTQHMNIHMHSNKHTPRMYTYTQNNPNTIYTTSCLYTYIIYTCIRLTDTYTGCRHFRHLLYAHIHTTYSCFLRHTHNIHVLNQAYTQRHTKNTYMQSQDVYIHPYNHTWTLKYHILHATYKCKYQYTAHTCITICVHTTTNTYKGTQQTTQTTCIIHPQIPNTCIYTLAHTSYTRTIYSHFFLFILLYTIQYPVQYPSWKKSDTHKVFSSLVPRPRFPTAATSRSGDVILRSWVWVRD